MKPNWTKIAALTMIVASILLTIITIVGRQ